MNSVIVPLLVGAALALVSMWTGLWRGKKERALDRRIQWHEDAVKRLAAYEEELERLRADAFRILIESRIRPESDTRSIPSSSAAQGTNDLPRTFSPTPEGWHRLVAVEERVREVIRLGDVYITEERLRIECSAALSRNLNLVSTNFLIYQNGRPVVPWADLQVRVFAVARLRREIQESLSVILELEGTLATLLGPKYRNWRLRRRLDKVGKELERERHGVADRSVQPESQSV